MQAASADELRTPTSPAAAHQQGDPQPTMADISFRKALHSARAAASHAEAVLDGAPAERRTFPPASPEASGLRRDVSSLHSRALLLELELAESQRSCDEAAARHAAELSALRHAHEHDLARLRADAEAVLAAANADAPAMLAASAALTTQTQQLAAAERLVAAAQLEARQAHAEAKESAAAAEELRTELAQLRADEGRTRARQDAVLFEARLAVERAEAELRDMQLAVENERRAGDEARAHAENLEGSYGSAAEAVEAAHQRLMERDAALAEAAQEQQSLRTQLQAAALAASAAETERDIVAARLDALKSALGTGSAMAAARADAGSEACSDLAVVPATPAPPSHAAATPPESLPLAFALLVQHASVAESALRIVQQAQRGAASNLGRRVVDAATAVQAAADAAGAVHSLQATLRALAQEPAAAAALSSGDVVLSRSAAEPAGESELASARARCTHLEEREDALQRQLAAAQAARDAATLQAVKLEAESSRRVAAEADAAALRQSHDAIIMERAQLQASLTAATASLSASEAALRAATSQRDTAAADLAALREAANAEAAEHTRLAASLQTSLDSIKASAVAEIEALQSRVLRLKAKVVESRRREQDMLAALQDERRARESDAAAMRARGDSVVASTSEQLGAALARVAELEAALDAFAVAAATRNATASEQQAAADAHAAQVAELQAALTQVEEESLASSFALVVRYAPPASCDFARDIARPARVCRRSATATARCCRKRKWSVRRRLRARKPPSTMRWRSWRSCALRRPPSWRTCDWWRTRRVSAARRSKRLCCSSDTAPTKLSGCCRPPQPRSSNPRSRLQRLPRWLETLLWMPQRCALRSPAWRWRWMLNGASWSARMPSSKRFVRGSPLSAAPCLRRRPRLARLHSPPPERKARWMLPRRACGP